MGEDFEIREVNFYRDGSRHSGDIKKGTTEILKELELKRKKEKLKK